MKNFILGLATGVMLLSGCTEDSPVTVRPEADDKPAVEIDRNAFAKGADVSWITQLEHEGFTFANQEGVQKECMALLSEDCGVNAIRLRVWVDPAEGWNNIHDVAIKARRANNLGLRLMIDFHFSDTWADPGNQITPAAWADMELPALKTAMAAHVSEMLNTLKDLGIAPEWVQLGNETRSGMLYPLGAVEAHFAELVDAGYDAVKAVFPDTKVIVHIDCGNEPELYSYVFDDLAAKGARYDQIGMSLYPEPENWQQVVDDCLANIQTVNSNYGKRVVIAEIGMDYRQAEAADAMMRAMVKGCTQTGVVDGIFWWEPEAPASKGYMKGCFNEGVPTQALDIFKETN